MKDTSKFLTADEVATKIEKLKRVNWPKYNATVSLDDYIEQVSDFLTEAFNTLPDVVEFLKASQFGFKLFRVRELSTFSNINLIGEHSYPPMSLTTKLNRCNFPKYPVFYGSNNAMTALAEVVRNDDYKSRRYCISRWTVHQSDEEVLLQPYLFGQLHADNQFTTLQKNIDKRLPSVFENKLTREQEAGMRLYLKFMADTFINDDSYELSAFFAHRRFYAPHNLRTEILIYPSVQTLYKGVNIAIHPNFVDNKMSATRFYIVEVNSFDKEKGLINISFSAYGTVERSQIIWTNVTPQDIKYRQFIKEDFDHDGEFEFVENAP
jgi:hypothetical protein